MLKLLSQAAGVGSFAVGVIALNVGVGGLNCAPTAYCKFDISGGKNDIVVNPRMRVKFGNASITAMFIHEIYYEIDGKRSSTLAPAFKSVKTLQLSTESKGFMSSKFSPEPRAWKKGGLVTLATIRPQAEVMSDNKWTDSASRALREHNVLVVVSTSIAPTGLAEYFTRKTSRLPLVSFDEDEGLGDQ